MAEGAEEESREDQEVMGGRHVVLEKPYSVPRSEGSSGGFSRVKSPKLLNGAILGSRSDGTRVAFNIMIKNILYKAARE